MTSYNHTLKVFDRSMHRHPREPHGTMGIDVEKKVFVEGHAFPL